MSSVPDPARLRADAEAVFRAGVARVDPRRMVRDCLRLEGGRLAARAGGRSASWDLGRFRRVLVLAFGKAACRMAAGAADVLGGRIGGGLAVVKSGSAEAVPGFRVLEAAHPVPDGTSVAAARAVLEAARGADRDDLVLVLVSGGGSALLAAPLDEPGMGVSLADKQATTRELLACGADIREVNTVRRHLSAVKGGRLAAALAPATVATLILSDVIGDELASIASGPTVPDPSTWGDALAVLRRRGIAAKVPRAVLGLFEAGVAGKVPDTPKPGDPAFARTRNLVIGSNRLAALAARDEARRLGYRTLYLGSRFEGEARELARAWLGMGLESASRRAPIGAPACVLGGGEATVTLRGSGKGGRNQEAALAFLAGLGAADPAASGRVCFLSAGTDGNDGPTDAAGAFADLELLGRARAAGLDPAEWLATNDSYAFHDAIGGLLRTGPTGTNVCDLQVLLVR